MTGKFVQWAWERSARHSSCRNCVVMQVRQRPELQRRTAEGAQRPSCSSVCKLCLGGTDAPPYSAAASRPAMPEVKGRAEEGSDGIMTSC
jgi:hypothetical protein